MSKEMLINQNRVASKLKLVLEPALERWSGALRGVIDDELIGFLRHKVRVTLDIFDSVFSIVSIRDIGISRTELCNKVLILDKAKYQFIKDELLKAFKEQIGLSGLSDYEIGQMEGYVDLLSKIIEDSISADLLPALLNQIEKVEAKEKTAGKMFRETTRLLEWERQRLAFDLHDGPAQALSSAILQADMLDDMVKSEEARKELESLKAILNQCLKELRSSIYSLKPQSLSKNGLLASISGYLKQFSLRTGVEVKLITRFKENNLPEDIQVNVFRIIQEALNNVYKHSKADQAIVCIEFGRSKISCSVEDNGIGFEVYDCQNSFQELGGYGLMIMMDRAKQLQGSFKIESERGKGTRIEFSIPM